MSAIYPLLCVIDAYRDALGLHDKTVSSRVFADSKKIAALRNGAEITVGRYADAMRWFSEHWPDEADWPQEIERPQREAAQ